MNKEKWTVVWFVIKRWWFWWFGSGDKAMQFGEELPVDVADLRNPKKRENVIANLKARVSAQIAGFSKKMKAEPLMIQAFRRRTAERWTIQWTCAFQLHTRRGWKKYVNRMQERKASQMVHVKDWEAMIWKREPVSTPEEKEAAPESGANNLVTSDLGAPTVASTVMPDTTQSSDSKRVPEAPSGCEKN